MSEDNPQLTRLEIKVDNLDLKLTDTLRGNEKVLEHIADRLDRIAPPAKKKPAEPPTEPNWLWKKVAENVVSFIVGGLVILILLGAQSWIQRAVVLTPSSHSEGK